MKLNLKQIKSITQGAAYITADESGIQFHRFNEAEETYYKSTSHSTKTFSTSGIQMVFKTDADKLSMKANVSVASTRKFFSFDIYINGELSGEFKNYKHEEMHLPYSLQECELGDFSWEMPMKEGEKTLRIVFPFGSKPTISEISLENATFIEPVKRSKTMLMYGDSITHGYDALNPSRAYAVQLAHALDAEAINKAIGGEVFRSELSAIKNDINPDYITVAYGTNDWSKRTKEAAESDCRGFYENLRKNYPDAKIFAITPIWRGDMDNETKFGKFSDAIKMIHTVCEEIGGITVIDGFEFVPAKEEFFADLRLHPTNEGFDLYAASLLREIEKYI